MWWWNFVIIALLFGVLELASKSSWAWSNLWWQMNHHDRQLFYINAKTSIDNQVFQYSATFSQFFSTFPLWFCWWHWFDNNFQHIKCSSQFYTIANFTAIHCISWRPWSNWSTINIEQLDADIIAIKVDVQCALRIDADIAVSIKDGCASHWWASIGGRATARSLGNAMDRWKKLRCGIEMDNTLYNTSNCSCSPARPTTSLHQCQT